MASQENAVPVDQCKLEQLIQETTRKLPVVMGVWVTFLLLHALVAGMKLLRISNNQVAAMQFSSAADMCGVDVRNYMAADIVLSTVLAVLIVGIGTKWHSDNLLVIALMKRYRPESNCVKRSAQIPSEMAARD